MIFRILFVLFVLSGPAAAQQLRSLQWIGVEDVTSLRTAVLGNRQLPLVFATRSEFTLELQRIQRETTQWLVSQGYYFAEIDSVRQIGDSLAQDISIFVGQGRKFVISRISVIGDTLSRLIYLETKPGEVLQPDVLEEDIRRMLLEYEAAGFPLAKISVASVDIDSVGLLVTLRAEKNGEARIGRITVEGNTTTRPHVIIREFGLREGELLVPSRLEQGRTALERLGYFEAIEQPQIYLLGDSSVEVRILVREARTTTIDAVLGYNPPRIPTESGYISGLVDLGFRNIAGTARDAAVHYSSITQGTQRLSASYREPWLFSYPLHVDLAFDQYQQDSSYVSTQMRGGLTYSLSQSLDVSASLLYDRIIPTDLPESPFIAFNSRKLLTLLSATYDSRDELLAPTTGILLKIAGNYGSKRLNGPDRFLPDSISRASTLSELSLDLSAFQSTFTPKL
ncbi:MAG TPA: POTRA domain-containing protein, partial [Candidatus Kapabacteria bacterium]|nr:POTRA domain-containing protein [Candidatus Kapabacteria bacterium]